LSDLLLNPTPVNEGQRRIMIAVPRIGVSSSMIIPLIDQLWMIIALLAVTRAFGAAGSALNFALVTDLVRNRGDIGKVTATAVVGGNTLGLAAPIVTGYVVQITGSFDNAFYIAGFRPLIGAIATLTMTRKSIMPDRLAPVTV
jgi:ACS family glucarate transporter-like MFS transporter